MKEVVSLHRAAMDLLEQALLLRREDHSTAQQALTDAFKFENEAAQRALQLGASEPTLSVLHRSAATIGVNAGLIREAEAVIYRSLAYGPPEEIKRELKALLETATFHEHLSINGLELRPEEFQLTLAGPGVAYGMIRSNELVDRVGALEVSFVRSAERHMNRPFREGGSPAAIVRDQMQLYMAVPRPGSFAVSFRVGQAHRLLHEGSLPEVVIQDVLENISLVNHGREDVVQERIGDDAYFRSFIGLTKRLAPDGDSVTGVGLTSPGLDAPVELRRPRSEIEVPPRSTPTLSHRKSDSIVSAIGHLEYANKASDRNVIRLREPGKKRTTTVVVPPGMMSDVVKPMWEERVIVSGYRVGSAIHMETIDLAPEATEEDEAGE